MSKPRYTAEFKSEAVKQVTECGYSVADVAERLGVSTHSLYVWLRAAGTSRQQRKTDDVESLSQENARLKRELGRLHDAASDLLEDPALHLPRDHRERLLSSVLEIDISGPGEAA